MMLALFFALALTAVEYPADVVRVIDGDTVAVVVRAWPSVLIETRIRILGIDAPELKARCPAEKEKAIAAREFVRQQLPVGAKVTLRRVKPDKYAGRHDAEIWTAAGESVGDSLIAHGLARAYGGAARLGWCNL